ncbi:hypothetical protein DFJ74DRAFT_713519 [Hyaloraphidium curvatum]|nr:hypothetical protein DFJ74DRAFT_713519 [Hyaloraphidium curvatum]
MSAPPTLLTPNVLTVASYHSFRPVAYRAPDGQPAGRDLDFLSRFASRHGLELRVVWRPFDGIWTLPGREECDVACGGIAPLPSRRAEASGVEWTRPYFKVKRALVIRAADAGTLRTMDDFVGGRTVAVTKGSTAEADAIERLPATGRMVHTSSQGDALRLLSAGEIDAYATGDVPCDYIVATFPGFAVADRHEFREEEVFCFAVRGGRGLKEVLDGWIEEHGGEY